jgi:hypothetical protein
LGRGYTAASDLKELEHCEQPAKKSRFEVELSDCDERKGHDFVVLDLELAVNERLVSRFVILPYIVLANNELCRGFLSFLLN